MIDRARSLRGPGAAPSASSGRERDTLKRGGLLLSLIAAYLLFLLWFVTRPPARPPAVHGGGELTMISLSNGKQAARRSAIPDPPPIAMPSIPPSVVEAQSSPPAASEASQAGAPGGCGLSERATAAIVKDPQAMAELAALPAGYRTSADAVMLWNGQWVAGAPGTDASPVAPSLRRDIEQVVSDASPECRAEPMGGPQFLPIPEHERTTTLVIGSGLWRWSDLLAPAACNEPTPDACLTSEPTLTDQLF